MVEIPVLNTTTEYGFQGRLTKEFPSQFILDITELCNLSCVHCPHPEFKQSEHYAGRSLDVELCNKLVDEVREHGKGATQYLRFASNGEPLAHKQVFEMLEYAVKNSGTTVTLTTNGKIMNPARVERIVDIGVDIVDISLDAFYNDSYSSIRVGGNLDVTRTNVLNLIQASKQQGSKTKVVVSFVEQPQNSNEVEDFEKFWKDNGADYVVIRRMHSCSGAKADLAVERRELFNTRPDRRPCLYPWERLVLNAKGWISFCPSDWVHGSLVADYRNSTIKEIWQGEFMTSLRNAHLTNNYSNHHFCGQCPDWASTRWPLEGRSYADMVMEFKETE